VFPFFSLLSLVCAPVLTGRPYTRAGHRNVASPTLLRAFLASPYQRGAPPSSPPHLLRDLLTLRCFSGLSDRLSLHRSHAVPCPRAHFPATGSPHQRRMPFLEPRKGTRFFPWSWISSLFLYIRADCLLDPLVSTLEPRRHRRSQRYPNNVALTEMPRATFSFFCLPLLYQVLFIFPARFSASV